MVIIMGIRNILVINPTDSDTIKAAKIGAVAIIIAAAIGGIFALYPKDKSSNTINPSNIGSSINVIGDIRGNVYLNAPENVSETTTSRVIRELQSELNQTENNVTLTREEIRLLSLALKDLDQRTSDIQKLPDGRTKFGAMISGTPSIVIQEYNAAEDNFKSGDYNAAFYHAQNAIKAYEESKKEETGANFVSGNFNPEGVSMIYITGAKTAQKIGNNSLAYQYAKTALDASDTPFNNAAVASTLLYLGNYTDALNYSKKALQAEPNNSWFIGLNYDILKANAMQK
jgi:tetratricopeptide (TPR) repeat protein